MKVGSSNYILGKNAILAFISSHSFSILLKNMIINIFYLAYYYFLFAFYFFLMTNNTSSRQTTIFSIATSIQPQTCLFPQYTFFFLIIILRHFKKCPPPHSLLPPPHKGNFFSRLENYFLK